MNKTLIKIIILSFFFGACSSSKKIYSSAKKLDCDKKICFVFDRDSNFAPLTKNGDHFGDSKFPDYESIFISSVMDFAENSKLDIENSAAVGIPTKSVDYVKIKIEKIDWTFTFFSAKMDVHLIYEINNQIIPLVGENHINIFFFGTKKGQLYKSLLNGHYSFLQSYCYNLN
ncbi:hypothetical protein [Formosa haliotis]|uniref:hypothetical protein n=1 Tax=Formosa haliotis TaxID=1555194 RepID=UPI0008262196|nr:hypothetical protein [Formosa haliotis]